MKSEKEDYSILQYYGNTKDPGVCWLLSLKAWDDGQQPQDEAVAYEKF